LARQCESGIARLWSIVRGAAQCPNSTSFRCANRVEMELDVPLVVGEIAEGAMLFFRRRSESFRASEIAQAGALGKRIALAMQANRVSEAAEVASRPGRHNRSNRAPCMRSQQFIPQRIDPAPNIVCLNLRPARRV
jgi:hypothetical protein